jgi:hypothetical protein
MEFGSRRGPLHPELAVWRSCPHGELAEEEEEEEKKEKKECTVVRDPHLAGGEILGKKHNVFQRHKLFKRTANTYKK